MRYYLSSYKLGNSVAKLQEMTLDTNKRVAYIPNARDYEPSIDKEKDDLDELTSIGLEPTKIDLKEYFHKESKLRNVLSEFDIFWVRGGNTFVLRQAMYLSGFDNIIIELNNKKSNKIYGGYSAGVCVPAPTLHGLEIIDDIKANPYGQKEIITTGLNIINYSIAPHYRSNHPESASIELEIQEHIKNKRLFKALQDGEVIIIE